MTQEVFVTNSGSFPVASTVLVSNFVDLLQSSSTYPMTVTGSVSISGAVTVGGTVLTALSYEPDGFNWVPTSYGSPGVLLLPGYNTVTPTIEIGPMTASTMSTQPVALMLWDSANNQWRAARCNSSGFLQVAI